MQQQQLCPSLISCSCRDLVGIFGSVSLGEALVCITQYFELLEEDPFLADPREILINGEGDLFVGGSALDCHLHSFVPPEVLLGENISIASKIYICAGIFLYLTTGSTPFLNASPSGLKAAILSGQRVSSVDSSRALPLVVEQILETAFSLDPSYRYRSKNIFLAMLSHACGEPSLIESKKSLGEKVKRVLHKKRVVTDASTQYASPDGLFYGAVLLFVVGLLFLVVASITFLRC